MCTERTVLQGINEATYEQNIAVVDTMRNLAPLLGEGLLGIQVLGSRGNGTSCEASDLDLAVLTFNGNSRREILHEVRDETENTVPKTDTWEAAGYLGVTCSIPSSAPDFVRWIQKYPGETAGLFEDGIHASAGLLALRAAALHVLETRIFDQVTEDVWRRIWNCHAYQYFSNGEYIRSRLSQRVGVPDFARLCHVINNDVVDGHNALLALPASVTEQEERIMEELDAIPDEARKGLAFDIYDDVMSQA